MVQFASLLLGNMVLLRFLALVTFLLGHTAANIHNANLNNLLASDGKELALMFAP